MNLTFSKKDDFKKILTKSKPGLIRLAKELYIEDISDDFFLEIVIPLSFYLNSFNKKNTPYLIGLTGGQGSGKTTLSLFIQQVLQDIFKRKAVGFSIDDIYKTKSERNKIAKKIHPDKLNTADPNYWKDYMDFKDTVNSMDKENWGKLFEIADRHDIYLKDYDTICSDIELDIEKIRSQIENEKSSYSWKLYECKNDKCKDMLIKSFLLQLFDWKE